MLNKDQYNQEEYNNYYKQESEGVELLGIDDGGNKGKIIIFLGLISLAVAGYFGLKMFNATTDSKQLVTKDKLAEKEESPKEPVAVAKPTGEEERSKEPMAVAKPKEEVKVVEVEKIQDTIKEEVANQVQASMKNNQKMSPDEISKVVELVMSKMDQNKDINVDKNTKVDKDTALLSALEKTDTDTIKVKVEEKKTVDNTTEAAVQEKKEPISNNNRVTIKSTDQDEDLTKLSEQIKKLLNMSEESSEPHKKAIETTIDEENIPSSNNKDYTESISSEIETRSNEMRIIVVKPGDTLNKIAKRVYGDGKSYYKIITANPDILNQDDKIYVGQKLRIPK